MNETIGVKGGKNDRRRSLIIKKAQKKKLQDAYKKEQLKQLEKKVKHIQVVSLIKVLPVALTGQVFKTLIDNTKKKSNIDKEEVFSKLNIVEHDVNISNVENKKLEKKTPDYIYSDKIEKAFSERTIEEKIDLSYKIINNVEVREVKQEEIPLIKVNEEEVNKKKQKDLLNVKNKKIVESYEEQLKEARKELRKAYFEYKIIVCENEEQEDKQDEKRKEKQEDKQDEKHYEKQDNTDKKIENVIDNLSILIFKVGDLKNTIKVKNKELLDDNYLTDVIEEYIEEFKNNRDVLEIKDSDIYKIISEKVQKIKEEKEEVTVKTEIQKVALETKEIDLTSLKEKYYNYEKFNQKLLEFQNEQDYLLKEIKEKVKNAVSVEEKMKVEVSAMDKQSKKLFRLVSLQMFLPGARSAKALGVAAATYLYFINNVIKPKTVTKKYKVINVKDYSRDIESSMLAIDDVVTFLGRTKLELNKTIKFIKNEYGDYLDESNECKSLLKNLEKLNQNLDEKEYEITSMKKEQLHLLEKNNAKVLKYKN